jgi:integron integrase
VRIPYEGSTTPLWALQPPPDGLVTELPPPAPPAVEPAVAPAAPQARHVPQFRRDLRTPSTLPSALPPSPRLPREATRWQATQLQKRVREAIRARHLSPLTERAYASWVWRFIWFHRRPAEGLTSRHVAAFLTSLAAGRKVAASTQAQALSALVFLYRDVLGQELRDLGRVPRAKTPMREPAILSHSECRTLMGAMHGTPRLMAALLYGAGLRADECCRLRVMDLDFSTHRVTVRGGKGAKDRVTIMPTALADPLRAHLEQVRRNHQADQAEGHGSVALPEAELHARPDAAWDWAWQWVFPSARLHFDRQTQRRTRRPFHRSALHRAVAEGVAEAGIIKAASCHTLRHSFATHLLESGHDVRTIQELLGHRHVSTTMVYLHATTQRVPQGPLTLKSPLD